MEKDMKTKIKYSRTDKIVLGIGYTLLGLFVLAIIVPLVYVVLASFMDPTVLNNQGLSFNIKDWTIDAYRRVLENDMIWRGFFNSFFYSIAFAAISVCRKKIFQCDFYYHNVFWRRNDSYIHPYKSAPYGKHRLGNPHSGRFQCVEYDFGENLLSVSAK